MLEKKKDKLCPITVRICVCIYRRTLAKELCYYFLIKSNTEHSSGGIDFFLF